MRSNNYVRLLGRLGRDVDQMKFTAKQTPVINFSIATSKKMGDEELTSWHRIVVFGKAAEWSLPLLKKGVEVSIDGELQQRKWKDKEGLDRETIEVIADQVRICMPRQRAEIHEDSPIDEHEGLHL